MIFQIEHKVVVNNIAKDQSLMKSPGNDRDLTALLNKEGLLSNQT